MNIEQVIKSDQEQAVASWINYLNQLRLDALMSKIHEQDDNLQAALKYLDDSLTVIRRQIIDNNRGGNKGMHGFIAEVAEVGIGNARQVIRGENATHEWLNNNGPVDFLRDGVPIQQKFYHSADGLSIDAMRNHLHKYPDFIKNGGKYQIPKDQYNKILYLISIPQDVANKMSTSDGSFSLNQWKYVRDFFDSGEIDIKSIEPSSIDYKDAQVGAIGGTISKEKRSIKETDKIIRDSAYEQSRPSLKEGAQAAIIGALSEGGSIFVLELIKAIRLRKGIRFLKEEDWNGIISKSGIGLVKGGIRGSSIYALSNYTATPVAVASALVASGFGIAEQFNKYRKNEIDEVALIENSEILCLDAAMSAVFSIIGQYVIPVPVLGAIIGNTIGMVLYQNTKDYLFIKEQELIDSYLDSIHKLDERLSLEYSELILKLNKSFLNYLSLLNVAFSVDPLEALAGSVALAQSYGIPLDETLTDIPSIDRYFLD